MTRNRWHRFRNGEFSSTEELIEMRRDAKKTLAFMLDYKMSPALVYCLRQDIDTIERLVRRRGFRM